MRVSAFRRGFTLLEVLIALTLVTALMGLAWSLFATFSRLETRSRKTISGLEITRSLTRQIQDDLDQVLFLPAVKKTAAEKISGQDEPILPNELLEPFSVSELASSDLGLVESGDQPEFELLDQPFFQGERNSLSFLIHSNQAASPSTGNRWQVVIYEWEDPGTRGLQEFEQIASTDDDDETSTVVPEVNRVFVRRVMSYQQYSRQSRRQQTAGDVLLEGMETIDIGRKNDTETNDLESSSQQIDEIPELSEISFRYFDGNTWSSNWSGSKGALPLAVEVVFKIKKEDGSKPDGSGESSEQGVEINDEIEIGIELESDIETDFELEPLIDGQEINPSFDADSHRILIRIGTHQQRKITDLTGSSDLDFQEFEMEDSK